MQIQKQRLAARLLRLLVLALVIGITWYVYEDYVNTTNAQPLQDQPAENKVTQEDDKSIVQGVIDIAPKPRGILIVPAQ